MSKLLIDVTRLVSRLMDGRLPTGVDRVGLAYVQYYGRISRAVIRWAGRSWVLPEEQSKQLFAWLIKHESSKGAAKIIATGIARGWYRQRTAGQILFNTGHSGLENIRYPTMLKQMGVRPVFVVHDLIPITHPEYSRPGEAEKHIQRIDQMLSLASGVVANSLATLDDLSTYAKKSAKPLPPSTIGLLAPGMQPLVPGARPIAAPYFVMLSTIEPRKNHVMILQIWRRLIETYGDQAPRLIVIGQRGWECENVIDLLERCIQLKGYVTELSRCSDQELVTYLHHSQALLFPSFVEGYGMPLVEALALGTPVIASDLSVFREIADDIPEYVDPLDGIRWAELVIDYARPEGKNRAAQLVRMQNFKVPDWSEHFSMVDALLERLDQ
ncbi:glycosyltransferase involved in cell wall biosynthesis [Undibacterium sp. GrIS 1.2]|uniref:glycosyltransferase family 4 protein n=1 Tax=Undibacterium sp. GrIS 1.2 TaxID=3143933 RepID=UPI00339598FC